MEDTTQIETNTVSLGTDSQLDEITTNITEQESSSDLAMDLDTEKTQEQVDTEKSLAALDSLPEIEEGLLKEGSNYDLLVRRIDAYKLAGLSEELEAAREAMHEVYPLTEAMWLDWINDTREQVSTEQDDQRLRRIYQEAEQDYLSIPIWESYVDYIRSRFDQRFDQLEDKNSEDATDLIEVTREDLLKAVRATTYHVEKSHIIWDAYADFEQKLLECYKSDEQFNKLKQSYLDRLNVLHLACEETFSNYSQLISTYDNNNYEASLVEANKIYAATKVAAADRDYYEQQLKEKEYTLDAFYQYIENEKVAKKMKSLNHVRNLYERAVAIYCTDVALWEDYICFMMESANVLAFLQPIALRAVRNCPWSGSLWSHLARFMESSGSPLEQVIDIFDRAIVNKALMTSLEDLVTLMIAKCAHARRQINWDEDDEDSVNYLRLTFQEALMYINESFPDTGDPYCRIEKFWACIEAKRLNNIERAREIWDGVMKKQGRNSEAWLNYIDLERSLGNTHRCESLFKQALAKNIDYPERLLSAWLSMEYEEGTVQTLEESLVRTNKKTKELTREWQAALAQQEAIEEEKKQKELGQKMKKSAHRRKQKETKKELPIPSTSSKKRKLSSQGDDSVAMDVDDTNKKLKYGSAEEPERDDSNRKPAFTPTNRSTGRGRGGRGGTRRGGRVALAGHQFQQRPSSSSSTDQTTDKGSSSTSTTESRSNDDFRAMLLAGRK